MLASPVARESNSVGPHGDVPAVADTTGMFVVSWVHAGKIYTTGVKRQDSRS